MKALPVGLIFACAVTFGILLGFNYLRGIRKPAWPFYHLLLGAATLEGLVMLMHGVPNGARAEAGTLGGIILALLAASMFSGLTWPMAGRFSARAPNAVLAAHAGIGLLGFALFLIWASRL